MTSDDASDASLGPKELCLHLARPFAICCPWLPILVPVVSCSASSARCVSAPLPPPPRRRLLCVCPPTSQPTSLVLASTKLQSFLCLARLSSRPCLALAQFQVSSLQPFCASHHVVVASRPYFCPCAPCACVLYRFRVHPSSQCLAERDTSTPPRTGRSSSSTWTPFWQSKLDAGDEVDPKGWFRTMTSR